MRLLSTEQCRQKLGVILEDKVKLKLSKNVIFEANVPCPQERYENYILLRFFLVKMNFVLNEYA